MEQKQRQRQRQRACEEGPGGFSSGTKPANRLDRFRPKTTRLSVEPLAADDGVSKVQSPLEHALMFPALMRVTDYRISPANLTNLQGDVEVVYVYVWVQSSA
ncbi:hypothetical protein EAI_03496 [Harpegnathos saltator]|uniref:Uncharacterized protein n=1 Tax=Harpegnathos saltator TaxID=610380 RepID=E2BDD3_HARSA|nr:hypothetical protein EAI_03496 [Harpegnathos saltator]